jgi:hypothetical protein
MHKKRRKFTIRLKAKRKEEIKRLREAYRKAVGEQEKKGILEKALRKNPNLTPEDFLKNL